MKDALQFLRGSVRPITTYLIVAAMILLVFRYPEHVKEFLILGGTVVGYWFGSRKVGSQ